MRPSYTYSSLAPYAPVSCLVVFLGSYPLHPRSLYSSDFLLPLHSFLLKFSPVSFRKQLKLAHSGPDWFLFSILLQWFCFVFSCHLLWFQCHHMPGIVLQHCKSWRVAKSNVPCFFLSDYSSKSDKRVVVCDKHEAHYIHWLYITVLAR